MIMIRLRHRRLLSEAGKTSLSLNLMYISTDKTMESEALYVQSALANVGITVNLLPTDESTFKNKTRIRNVQTMIWYSASIL